MENGPSWKGADLEALVSEKEELFAAGGYDSVSVEAR